MHVHNNLGSLPKIHSSSVNNNLPNHGFVNTLDVYQNVHNQAKFEQINMPCYTEADVMSQNCYSFDNYSKFSSYTAEKAQDASN